MTSMSMPSAFESNENEDEKKKCQEETNNIYRQSNMSANKLIRITFFRCIKNQFRFHFSFSHFFEETKNIQKEITQICKHIEYGNRRQKMTKKAKIISKLKTNYKMIRSLFPNKFCFDRFYVFASKKKKCPKIRLNSNFIIPLPFPTSDYN